eukprot:PhF_6_TR20533/c0_g1_i2/m.29638
MGCGGSRSDIDHVASNSKSRRQFCDDPSMPCEEGHLRRNPQQGSGTSKHNHPKAKLYEATSEVNHLPAPPPPPPPPPPSNSQDNAINNNTTNAAPIVAITVTPSTVTTTKQQQNLNSSSHNNHPEIGSRAATEPLGHSGSNPPLHVPDPSPGEENSFISSTPRKAKSSVDNTPGTPPDHFTPTVRQLTPEEEAAEENQRNLKVFEESVAAGDVQGRIITLTEECKRNPTFTQRIKEHYAAMICELWPATPPPPPSPIVTDGEPPSTKPVYDAISPHE